MISSTRSRESASRSSVKDASSVTSPSSMPSCSVRTSLTRSKTSSRDAAISPRLVGDVGARGIYHHPLRKTIHDAVFDPSRGQPDRVRDRRPGGVSVRDHREASEPEEVRAAVGVGVEPAPETACRGPDEQPTELAAGGGGDLLAERVEQLLDRPLEQLQGDVAREAVGDDDVGREAKQLPSLRVPLEVQPALAKQGVRLEDEL